MTGSADRQGSSSSGPVSAEQRSPEGGVRGTHGAEDGTVAQDCLGCRVTGCLFGVGGAGYLGSVLLQEPPPRGAHRYSVIAAAGTMFVFGMYRAFG